MSDVIENTEFVPTEGAATPASIVAALKAVAGNPPKVRASFAKGRCVRGRYVPSGRAAEITRSVNFTRPGRVLARFSMGGGNPNVADTNNLVLRGFSFRIETDGETSDILVESAPVHFARTLDQMLAFLKARIPGPDGKPDPAKVKSFSDANPETLNQAKYIAARSLPASFAGTTYWGVHSFPVINEAGKTRFIKFKIVPRIGEIVLTDEEAKEKAVDFLHHDLEDRIRNGGIEFDILALLDRPGDPTMDVTARWPGEDERETVVLGTITIDAIDSDHACDVSIFDPGTLAHGVGYPPDEIFAARLKAYRISLAKRQ
ncbi:catalase family peroxidase [Rhizobium sp. 42MFCr.1]|jgi:catalase|uniref:catalase family peroxidase n=1 Tax=Rhizobium sp. 42MFCr.1 TaxID=1048680 RepID=UPI00037ECFF6|nr:catalase family peroxidase [Rhizobium sp. 42MFCr.1]